MNDVRQRTIHGLNGIVSLALIRLRLCGGYLKDISAPCFWQKRRIFAGSDRQRFR
jgi:hypothetical protein